MGFVIPILRDAPFAPETVKAMAEVYDQVIGIIRDQGGQDVIDEVIARRIIVLAQRGITDARRLRDAIFAEFCPDIVTMASDDEQTPETCRANAARCLHKAANASDVEMAREFDQLARQWLDIANEIEKREPAQQRI